MDTRQAPPTVTIVPCYRPYVHEYVYAVQCLRQTVYVYVTKSPIAVRGWIHRTLSLLRYYPGHVIVGLGVQWRSPHHFKGSTSRAATIQLCVMNQCLVFQVRHATIIPRELRSFLNDPRFTFVAIGMAMYQKKLWDSGRLFVRRAREIWWLVNDERMASSEILAWRYLGFNGSRGELKPKRIALSDWEAEELSMEQVMYACVDAFVSASLGSAFNAAWAY